MVVAGADAPTSRIVDTSSYSVVRLVRGLLEQCMTQHPQCHIPAQTPLPSRLLEVANRRVRLVETEGHEGAYLALSHCWGRTQIVQTKTANVAERMRDIPWGLLSKTFQDAIIFTWKLGYRYIWIDSLVRPRSLRLSFASPFHLLRLLIILSVYHSGRPERLGNSSIANGSNI
jgi:Heterokaryon incompatibility protein (HET)